MKRFCEQWERKYLKVVNRWRDNFLYLFTFMKFPPLIRNLIYTTNQLERLYKEIKRRSKVWRYYLKKQKQKRYYKERKLRNFEEEQQRYLEEKNKNWGY